MPSHYALMIAEGLRIEPAEASVVEEVLRAEPAYSTLDHLTRPALLSAARDAYATLAYLRTNDPEVAAWYEKTARS